MSNFLIIAASSSIGQATTELLRQNGHNVFTTSRSSKTIQPDAIVDSADFDALPKVFEQAQSKLGKINGIANFAGSLLLKKAHFTTKEQYEEVISKSLTTAFVTVKCAGQYLENASVVLLTSSAANIGLPNHEAIAAAKGGVESLVRAAAATYSDKNLRFNAVAPGLVKSNLTTQLVNNKASLQQSLSMHPLGRVGEPEDIARAVAFLLDPQNNWITGEILHVDGGLNALKTFS